MDNTALVIKLQNYIDICFRDALMTEGRSPESKYEVRWVLVKNPEGKWQFKVLKLYCQYEKVRRRAMYRLQKNLEKNFGIVWDSPDKFTMLTYEEGTIDSNHTHYMFKVGKKIMSLSVFDRSDEHFNEIGVTMAYRLERLLLGIIGIPVEKFKESPEKYESFMQTAREELYASDWKKFKEYYAKAEGLNELGRYDIVCGPMVQRI